MLETGKPPELEAWDQVAMSQLFDAAIRSAGWHRRWSSLIGRARTQLTLADAQGKHTIKAMHFAGVRAVPLAMIAGSEYRRGGFDRAFRPLGDQVRERWLSVASAVARGVALPPVELVQLGDAYFVRDGHHRISVAKATGQEVVDAAVTVLELDVSPSAACCVGWSPGALRLDALTRGAKKVSNNGGLVMFNDYSLRMMAEMRQRDELEAAANRRLAKQVPPARRTVWRARWSLARVDAYLQILGCKLQAAFSTLFASPAEPVCNCG